LPLFTVVGASGSSRRPGTVSCAFTSPRRKRPRRNLLPSKSNDCDAAECALQTLARRGPPARS
jgi:hypothetical protein